MRFFDHNATTPILPEARDAWLKATTSQWLNPSSPYRAAAAVQARLEEARERVASLFWVEPDRIVFNSGATEGNNAVFAHWMQRLVSGARVGVGATEHPSVLEAAKRYFGPGVVWLHPDSEGVLVANNFEPGSCSAVSVMAANNETGILNPWQDWARVCREAGITFHCDASQWIGKMPLDGLGACDFVTACAHKFGGPRGVGFMIVPGEFDQGLAGGVQERGRRAGTEDVPGILAMVAALEVCQLKLAALSAEKKEGFLKQLIRAVPGVEVVGQAAPALWNTASVLMPEFGSSRWIRALEKRGFLVSAGSACSTGKQGPSHVLAAVGVEADQAARVLRISSGWSTSTDDWEDLLQAMVESYQALRDEGAEANSRVISL